MFQKGLLFACRYKIILKDRGASAEGDEKKKSTDLLTVYDRAKKEWQLGKTKVCFFFLHNFSFLVFFCPSVLSLVSLCHDINSET